MNETDETTPATTEDARERREWERPTLRRWERPVLRRLDASAAGNMSMNIAIDGSSNKS